MGGKVGIDIRTISPECTTLRWEVDGVCVDDRSRETNPTYRAPSSETSSIAHDVWFHPLLPESSSSIASLGVPRSRADTVTCSVYGQEEIILIHAVPILYTPPIHT